MPRLSYEFKHLGLSSSPGYNPAYQSFDQIRQPDNCDFSFTQNQDLETEKGITNTMLVYGDLWRYIKAWLIDNAAASVNTILVKITDNLCTISPDRSEWIIKTDSLNWYLDDICELRVTLREYDEQIDCLKSTRIADNWRGWFPDDGFIVGIDPVTGLPNDNYMHPRFRYCDDIKPQALQNFMFVMAQSILIAFNTMVGPLIWMMQFANSVANTLGLPSPPLYNAIMNLVQDVYDTIFGEFLGCNRVHPAPFVRTYFDNACTKCGVDFESSIFNDPASLYYNSAHLFAPVKKGIRTTSTKDWIPDNEPIVSVWDYARSLRKVFNAKFVVRDGTFYFERKDFFNPGYVLDFTGVDKDKLLGKIQFAWSGETKPAYQVFSYIQDAFDQTGNESRHRFNHITEWNAANNPLLTGENNVTIEKYSTQRFTNDGVDKRVIFKALANLQGGFLDGLLLMSSDMTSVGKLIIWDPDTGKEEGESIRMGYGGYDISSWNDDWVGSNSTSDYYIYNQPYYYDPVNNAAFPNLYEFHKIDDPNLTSKKNIDWTLTMDGCCEDVVNLMFSAPGDFEINAKIDHLVKLSSQYDGIITRIVIHNDNRTIDLMGKVK